MARSTSHPSSRLVTLGWSARWWIRLTSGVLQQKMLQEGGVVRHADDGEGLGPSAVLVPHSLDAGVQGVKRPAPRFQQQLAVLIEGDLAPPPLKERGTPTSSSNREMLVLRLGWETNRVSAALDILPSLATAMKYLNCESSMPTSLPVSI